MPIRSCLRRPRWATIIRACPSPPKPPSRNLVEFITSHDDPQPGQGAIVNQVQHIFNGIDCLIADRQSHDGPVDGTTPEVGYQCSGDEPLIQRRTAIILPDGRLIPYDYGAENSIDDVLNRVASIHDDATLEVLATFGYLGAAMPAITTLPTPALQRRWKKLPGTPDGDGGDPYTAYDRFSRTEQSLWVKQTGETTYDPRVYVQWGYDRNSLRTWRKDLLAPAATQQDQAFLYDQLQQIVNRQRGVLNINHTAAGGIPAQTEHWDHDEQGNWKRYDTTEDGEPAIEQTRGHNKSNQITKVDGSSAPVAHDKNGNMTLVPTSAPTGPQGNLDGQPLKTTWDAWNRLRLVHDHNDVLLQDNRYDGLTRRTQEITAAGTRHFYYNDQWRSVEERIDTATTPERQHIWNPRDRWVLVLRDRSTENNRTLDERLYCLKDDLDPVAVADTNGAIVERYGYSAFGIVATLTPGFDPRQDNEPDFDWNLLFHAEFEDVVTGWMNYGYRYFVPLLGRWLRRDPITEGGGRNLYVFAENDGIGVYDVLGLRRPRDPREGIPIQPTPQPRPSAPRNDPAISDTLKTLKRLFDFFEQKNEAQAQMIEATIYAKAEAICQELYEAHDDPALPECGCCVYTLVVTLRYPGRPAGRLIPSTPTNGPVVRVHKVDFAYVPVECDEADRGGIPRNLMAARQTEIIKRRPQ